MNEPLLQSTHQSLGLALPGALSSLAEEDEAQLVAASQHGDQDAFARLVSLHQRRIFSLVFRMLQQYEESCEVTQETFLAAWQGLPAFRGEARFSTWLYRIAYNSSLKQLEQRKHDRALQANMEAEQSIATAAEQEPVDAQVEVHARQALVQEQISQLPAKYRIVLILRHLQDMSYEEMAELLKIPIGTIKTHLFRARNLLKERLEMLDHELNARKGGS